MNIKKAILQEHSKRQAEMVASVAGENKNKFKELMHCYLSEDYVLAQRAGYSVSIAGTKNASLVFPYIKDLVKVLSQKNVHLAVKRNSLRILETIEIPKKYQGKLMQVCFQFVENYCTPIAIKAYSITILSNLSKQYPEIKSELEIIIKDRWEHESPAFKVRGRKIFSEK